MRDKASRRLGLRGIVIGATSAMGVMVIAVATALIVLTTLLHRSSIVLRESMADVLIAQDAETNLLVHERTEDDRMRASIENDLRRDLLDAGKHVTSSAERTAFDRAMADVDRYLTASHGPAGPAGTASLLDAAYESLEELVNVNVAQADAAQEETVRWDKIANRIGVLASLVMLAILGTLALWIRRSVLQPLYMLSAAMDRFSAGALESRAPEGGAAELHEMAVRFNAMAASLSRQHRGRLTYLAGVAHDLRNPLAALLVSVTLIDPESPLPSEPRVRHVLAVVRRQVSRLNRMVEDLLEASRIEVGQLDLHLGDCDLNDVVRDVVGLFQGTSPLHNIRVHLADQPLPIRCDALRIEQTLNNLVSNAIKYSPRGGEIRITTLRDLREAVASVTDQGIGIAAEHLERIWEPFHRIANSTEMIPGVGLGLSVAKQIIHAHGGTMTVESTPDMGSTFSVRLPLREGEMPEGASPPLEVPEGASPPLEAGRCPASPSADAVGSGGRCR